jgi:pimeloyl-ACP methyl ester carboxylesterase
MLRFPLLIVGVGLVGLATTAPGRAQEKDKFQPVSFVTFDRVELRGVFYPGMKGVNSPTVMLLHKYGSDRTKGNFGALASHLHEKGYAVLAFDFRGHGASTTVDSLFWEYPVNKKYIRKPDPNRRTVSFKDFQNAYFPYLLHDIAAARNYLDKRNDERACNTSNLVVIGAEEGAALGFAWIAIEHLRDAIAPGVAFNPNPRKAGEDISGAIWLSFKRSPLGMTFPYSKLVEDHAKIMRERIPMWFAAGADDSSGVSDAAYMHDTIMRANRSSSKVPSTKLPIKGTKLRGIDLYGQAKLETDALLDKYLEMYVKRRATAAWENRKASEISPSELPLNDLGFRLNP